MLWRVLWVLVVVVVGGMGCAAIGAVPGHFPAEPIDVPAGADQYLTTPRPDGVIGGPPVAQLEADITGALAKRGAPAAADGALAATASWVLQEAGQSHRVDPSRVEAAVRHFGFGGPLLAFAAFDSRLESWREALAKVPPNLPVTRYGIRLSPSGRAAAVVFGTMEIAYEPIAREFEPSQAVTLKGEIGGRFTFGHIYLTKPDGSVDEKRASSRALDVTFALTSPGKYQLEVMGDGVTGPVILSNVPLYVGVPEPPLGGVRGKLLEPEEAEQRLLVLLNDARRAAGLKPVAPDAELREMALAHSEDMAGHNFFSHVSPSTGTPEDRLRRSGILVTTFGENIASADSPESAHDGLMNSPGHRTNMLRPDFTHVGIGAQRHDTGLIVSLEFGRRPPAESLPKTAAQVEAAIAALRFAKNLPPVHIDPVYRAGAQAGAEAWASGADQAGVDQAIASGLRREVERLHGGRPAACSQSVELVELAQLEQIATLSQPARRNLGVGAHLRTDKHGSRLSTVILIQGLPCQ